MNCYPCVQNGPKMRSLIALGYVFAVVATGAVGRTSAMQGAAVTPSPMPGDRARATFEDVRVKTFMALVNAKEVGGKCQAPDAAKTQAKLSPPRPLPPGAPLDVAGFASSYYDIEIPWPGNNGLKSVLIEAEVIHLLGM